MAHIALPSQAKRLSKPGLSISRLVDWQLALSDIPDKPVIKHIRLTEQCRTEKFIGL